MLFTKPLWMLRNTRGTFPWFCHKRVKPSSLYESEKRFVKKLLNDFRSTKPKIVRWTSEKPIFFRV